ncbi:hypothetical protein [Pontibacter akesuensis]|nr:hypothetical protein [Pontibacter akesuensis]
MELHLAFKAAAIHEAHGWVLDIQTAKIKEPALPKEEWREMSNIP